MFLDDPPTVAIPGSIPAEVYKAGDTRLAIKINELVETIWSPAGI